MQNGSNIYLRKSVGQFNYRYANESTIRTASYDDYWDFVFTAYRPGKRKKPALLTPRNGTGAYLKRMKHAHLQLGEYGHPTDIPRAWGFVHTGNHDNQYNAVTRGENLLAMTELSPIIQNKIREEIMSGKAQLAVDLVELRKTKTMFANAGLGLVQLFRDVRSGRGIREFARSMNREGFSNYAGRKWLEYIYGWAPTVSGAFETADVLSKNLSNGSIVTGRVSAKTQRSAITYSDTWSKEESSCTLKATGRYEYTIRDSKLITLSQLGFTNPLSIAWELTPWSFVFDWFVDVGGYINRMDFALGISDVYWQYSAKRKVYQTVRYGGYLGSAYRKPVIGVNIGDTFQRLDPSTVLTNTFKGLKPFTNETVRLTSAVALVNQQLNTIRRVR